MSAVVPPPRNTSRKAPREPRPPVPTEAVEQTRLMDWATLAEGAMPELEALYHIPNGGKRRKSEAARFKRMGVKPGVPDFCLAVARGKYHALYIELKRETGGTASEKQEEWIDRLTRYGNYCEVCHGWESAKRVIEWYLNLKGAKDGKANDF